MASFPQHLRVKKQKPKTLLSKFNIFQFDEPDKYFLDYLQINFHIPYKHHIGYETAEANDILAAFYSFIPKKLNENRLKYDHWQGIHFPRLPNSTKHKQIAMQFSGRFWSGNTNYKWEPILNDKGFPDGNEKLVTYLTEKNSFPTTNIRNDIKTVYPAFEEIESYIQTICWNIWRHRKVTHTISRIDISKQKKSSLNPTPTFFVKKKWIFIIYILLHMLVLSIILLLLLVN